jgi:hypothetical protein
VPKTKLIWKSYVNSWGKTILIAVCCLTLCSCGAEIYQGTKSEWLEDAFLTIEANPEIKAISYWNENWEDRKPVEMVINSSPEALAVYTSHVGGGHFVTEVNLDSLEVLPPAYGCYHSAYPGFSINNGADEEITNEKIESFIDLAGKSLVWIYFSNSWHTGISFPQADAALIREAGSIPCIRMMAWSEVSPHIAEADPEFAMQKFIDGDFDDHLRHYARGVKAFVSPVMLEFGTEVNGNWMPWNGEWNGADEDTYGESGYPDGPERFRDAYRHIIDIFRDEGAGNVTWIFHANYTGTPDEEWNEMKWYYPGSDYIDWVGVSIYGPLFKRNKWSYSFGEVWDYVEPILLEFAADKPLAIFEFGVGEQD